MKNKFTYALVLALTTALVGCGSSEKKSDEASTYEPADNSSTEGDEIFESAGSEESTKVEAASDIQESPTVADTPSEPVAHDDYNEPAPAPAKKSTKKSSAKKPASHGGAFKAKMYTFSSDCEMKSEPSDESSTAGSVKAGKKLWVEGHDADWATVQKKSGPVYIRKSCL